MPDIDVGTREIEYYSNIIPTSPAPPLARLPPGRRHHQLLPRRTSVTAEQFFQVPEHWPGLQQPRARLAHAVGQR